MCEVLQFRPKNDYLVNLKQQISANSTARLEKDDDGLLLVVDDYDNFIESLTDHDAMNLLVEAVIYLCCTYPEESFEDGMAAGFLLEDIGTSLFLFEYQVDAVKMGGLFQSLFLDCADLIQAARVEVLGLAV
jgi:hypothetical protein